MLVVHLKHGPRNQLSIFDTREMWVTSFPVSCVWGTTALSHDNVVFCSGKMPNRKTWWTLNCAVCLTCLQTTRRWWVCLWSSLKRLCSQWSGCCNESVLVRMSWNQPKPRPFWTRRRPTARQEPKPAAWTTRRCGKSWRSARDCSQKWENC